MGFITGKAKWLRHAVLKFSLPNYFKAYFIGFHQKKLASLNYVEFFVAYSGMTYLRWGKFTRLKIEISGLSRGKRF